MTLEPKEHNGKTILAFNTILSVIAGKHAKIVSMEDIGKKTLIGGQSRLPENTLKALNRIMAEYGYNEGSIQTAILTATNKAGRAKVESTAMRLSPVMSLGLCAIVMALLAYFFEKTRILAIVLIVGILAFFSLRNPLEHRLRQIVRFSKPTEEGQYQMLQKMLEAFSVSQFSLVVWRILLLIVIGAVLFLTMHIVPYFD